MRYTFSVFRVTIYKYIDDSKEQYSQVFSTKESAKEWAIQELLDANGTLHSIQEVLVNTMERS